MRERLPALSAEYNMPRGLLAWQQQGTVRSLVSAGTPAASRILLIGASLASGAFAFAWARLVELALAESVALSIVAATGMAGLMLLLGWYVGQMERNLGPVCVLDLARRVIELPRLNIQISFDSVAAIGFAQGELPDKAESCWVTQVLLVTRADPVTKHVIALCPRGAGGAHAIASTIADVVGVEVVQCELNPEWVSHETVP